ncbi:hypothetical protein KP509_39G047800 [Ceratopteris richardii]|uniref:Uncharacterized protein n=1 Tax=Ceratopteris richardii TaxID=49495 RepID=A0A8T2Q1A4_CERRI|nr:hypothetical protein KP509_39G047800 [Ceratopteris richardii]
MASISTSSRIHVRWASLSACTRQSSRHYARTTFVRPALATDTSRMQTLYVEAQHSTNPVTNASPYSTAQEQLFTSTTSESSIPSSIQRDMLGQRLFLFNTSVCVTCCAMTAMLVVAIPTLLSIKRAAESLEKFLDVTREELPGTMAAVRLSGMEISDLTMELSDLSQEISSGMKNSARALRAAQDGILRVGNMASTEAKDTSTVSNKIKNSSSRKRSS